MSSVKDQIIRTLEDITGVKNPEVEFASREEFGDYSSNIAMQLAQKGETGNFLENLEWIVKNVKKTNWKDKKFNLPVGRLSPEVTKLIKAKSNIVCLNGYIYAKINGWLGHREGHKEVLPILKFLPYICAYPIEIYEDGDNDKRNLFAFDLKRFGLVVIEVMEEKNKNEIVTIFFVNPRRLKNGILGKYRIPSLQAPIKAAGASFSGLQEIHSLYSKLEAKSQAFSLKYEIKRNPIEYAKEISGKFNQKAKKLGITAENIGGFINFWLKKDILVNNLMQIDSKKEDYGKSDFLKGKKIMFEYGDANTHKLPHLGHLFSYTYGEATSRILAFAGANVRKACYQGDIGLHVAKCLWAFQKENPIVPKTLDGMVRLLQKLYQDGSKAFEDENTAEEIKTINKEIYNPKSKINKLWRETRQWSIDYYKKFEEELNINYDRYYYESEVYQKGQEIVEKNEDKVFKRSEGALIFEGSKYGLHDRVFVTKYGTPTYEAKDMYLQELKMQEWPMDLLIITTAYEQNGYFDVIFKALEALDKKYIGKLLHIGFGMINLKTGKMSSRTGEILGAVDVIEKVKELSKEQNSDPVIAQKVAIGAIKYSFLKNNPLQNIAFDLNESVAREGNSGPYLQYTVARCNSLTLKGQALKGGSSAGLTLTKITVEEVSVLRKLSQYPEIIEAAAKTYSPNVLCTYLYDLAQKFNTFYNKHKIVGSDQEGFRFKLTFGVSRVLKSGLSLLGIEAPDSM